MSKKEDLIYDYLIARNIVNGERYIRIERLVQILSKLINIDDLIKEEKNE